jgi:hypothetical protein
MIAETIIERMAQTIQYVKAVPYDSINQPHAWRC